MKNSYNPIIKRQAIQFEKKNEKKSQFENGQRICIDISDKIIANNYMKRWSASLFVREMKIKTTVK